MAIINKILKYFGMKLFWIKDFPRDAIRFIEAKEEGKELVGVEIGTYRGEHARGILKTLNMKMLYLIDPFEHYDTFADYGREDFNEIYNEAYCRVLKFGGKFKFIRKKSSDAVNEVPNNLDFVYIDGNHSYEYVKQDIKNYYPKIKSGGVLSGHDTFLPEVLKAVIEFATENKLDLRIFGNDWWVIKK